MKRLGIILATGFLATLFVGCGGGGIAEQPTAEEAASPVPPHLKQMMEQNSKNMSIKNQGPPKKK